MEISSLPMRNFHSRVPLFIRFRSEGERMGAPRGARRRANRSNTAPERDEVKAKWRHLAAARSGNGINRGTLKASPGRLIKVCWSAQEG
jgi:hypothetical protein